MRVKFISSSSEKKLEAKVNEFLEFRGIEIIDIQFQTGFGAFAVMIQYKKKV